MSNKSIKFILILILLLAAFLRFFRLETFTNWLSDDSARDVLVAKHMSMGEIIGIRPYAAHGLGLINNSPLYYYMLSFLWTISRNPIIMASIFAIFGILTVYLGFKLGDILIDKNFGLLVAFLLSISFVMVRFSRSIYQANLMPLWLLLFLVAMVKSLKNKSLVWLFLTELVLLFGLHLHYSVFWILPFGLVGLVFGFNNLNRKQKNFKNITVGILVFSFMVWWWNRWTYINEPFDQINFFNEVFKGGFGGFWLNLKESVEIIIKALMPSINDSYIPYVSVLGISGLLIFSSFIFKKDMDIKIKTMSFMSLVLLMMGFYKNSWKTDWIFITLFPIVIILVAYLIYKMLTMKSGKIAGLLALLIIGSLMSEKNKIYFESHSNEYKEARNIARIIINDYTLEDEKDLMVWHRGESEMLPWDWFSSSIWYFLEEASGQTLVKNVSLNENISNIKPKSDDYKLNYLVCSDFRSGKTINDCKNLFVSQKGKQNYFKLEEKYSNDLNYTIYKIY